MFRIAICDDEPFYLNKIEKLINKIFYIEGISDYKIDTYLSGKEFCDQEYMFMEYQAVFLDINMPDISGFNIAKKIKECNDSAFLVFITAFMDYVLEGYKMEALRFILKDMMEDMLPECIGTIVRKLKIQTQRVKYDFLEGRKEIFINKIFFIESIKHKLLFHIMESKMVQYSLYDKLDYIENNFIQYSFLRIHKSYLVNMKYINDIGNYKVKMKNGDTLPIPREKFRQVKEK